MNRLLAFFAFMTLVQPTFADECESLPQKVELSIKAFEKKVRGAEYCRGRHIARGDINSDGTEDLVVVFNVEGACNGDKDTTPGGCGNHHETYLKAFLGKELREVPVFQVGGRGERFINGVKVRNGVVEAETLSYGEEDSMCCPSIEGKTQFVLKRGKFREKHL